MVVPRTQCISIIDESVGNQARNNYNSFPPPAPYPQSVSSSAQAIANDWTRFRDLYPNNSGTGREFWLLQPGRTQSQLLRPTSYINDSLTHTVTVARDNGNVASRSDWFAICNLGSQPPGSYVSLWLDVSGSMRKSTVLASYNYFIERCAAEGINVVYEESDQGERWSADQAVDFPPSASFSTDPNHQTNFNEQSGVTIPYNGTAVLSWIVFGDTTSANILPDVGVVSDPSGTITVNPTSSTNYTLTVVGPAGTTTRQVTVTVLPPPPPTVTFTITPNNYIDPGSATLSWDVTGVNVDFLSINNGIGNVLPLGLNGSIVVNPSVSRTYTITAKNFGGALGSTTTKSVDLTVYEPTVATIFINPNPITVGQTPTLSWVVSGDADTATIDQGIGAVLLTSNTPVSPSTSTTYTITASGPGGTDTASVTANVCQIPQISANFPANIDYGEQFNVDITYAAAPTVQVTALMTYTDGSVANVVFDLAGNDSDKNITQKTETFNSSIVYTDFGPEFISYSLSAQGCGGTTNVNVTPTLTIEIDELPDNITIPDSLEQIPSDDVEAPEIDIVLSDPIVVTDIDIPVEIRSDKPIQVRFDDADPLIEANWKDVRSRDV